MASTVAILGHRDSVPTKLPPRVVSRTGAHMLGLSSERIAYRLRAGLWRSLLPGVYLTRPEAERSDLVTAALLYAGPRSVLSGGEALLRYRLRNQLPSQILVLTSVERRPKKLPWLLIRPTRRLPEPVNNYRDIRVAPLARSVADYCLASRNLDDVRAVVARAIQRQACTLASLQAELEAGPRNGSGWLRRALAEIALGAWSAPEAAAGHALRQAGVEAFEQNARIDLRDGRYFIVDFCGGHCERC